MEQSFERLLNIYPPAATKKTLMNLFITIDMNQLPIMY